MDQPLWRPSPDRIAAANLTAFMEAGRGRWGVAVPDYPALHRWSVERPEQFWVSVWDFCGVIAGTRGDTVLEHPGEMPGARFFPDARLNFAENLLRRRDDAPAIVFWGENRVKRTLSHRELHEAVSRSARALSAEGVTAGDRVAGYL